MTASEPAENAGHANEELARPAKADGAQPLRRCAVTRAERSTSDMIRFGVGPDLTIVPDIAGKLPGRGIWVEATRTAVAEAAKRNVFQKSLKRPVKTAPDLADIVDRLLAEAARQALSFATKAGLVVTGFNKVEEAIEAGRAVALMQAHDASEDGVERLKRKFVAERGGKGLCAPVVRIFSIDELSLAIGRSNVVHAALAAGGQADVATARARRLMRYRLSDLNSDFTTQGTGPAGKFGTITEQA